MKNIVFLEFAVDGDGFGTGIIVEIDLKLEDGRQTSLDKVDRYFYETKLSLFIKNGRPHIPFK